MAALRFGVLGPLEVRRDDEPVPIPSGRRRAALACLLVHAGRPVAADTLVEAAWADEVPVDPRAALHTVLSRLRGPLGEQVVRSDPAGYVLDVSADAVDARRFEVLRARAASAPPEEAGRLLDRALGLWRGPAYVEFADRDFAVIEAQRLDLLRLDAVEACAALSVDGDDPEDAVARLESLLAEQPFREHALHLLMTALYRAGRAADALARYREYRTVLADELGLDPSPALRDLEMRILGHDLPLPRARTHPGPPAWLDTSSAFVGRDAALVDLVEAVAFDRAVTVTGVGGVGKTRLVAQALPALSERLAAPITVVELAPVHPGHADAAVAEALGLSRPTSSVRADVVEYLSISDGVLVLDNCEHLVAEVASLVAVIVRRCPRIRVVATSRHRLGTASERVLPLGPLPVPHADAIGERARFTAAVRLFTDRVRRVRPGFGITGDNLPAVVDICRRLDGLPLALELAASRAAVLGPGPVRERLAQSPAVLDAQAPDAPSVGLGGVVDWSYRLLSAEQRRLLALLSVFVADFDLEAVRGVASALGAWDDGRSVAEPLAELVDASLLSAYDARGEMRYRMLTIVRTFAAERLVESGEAADANLAHAAWFRHLVEQAAADSIGPRGSAVLARLNQSRADLVEALRWALDAGHLTVAGAITGAVELCPHWIPELELSDLIVAVGERCAKLSIPGSALAVAAGGSALAGRGELDRSQQLARVAQELAATPTERFQAHLALGVATIYSGAHEESARWWRDIISMEELPIAYRAEAQASLALLACYHDDLHAARQQATIALASAEASGAAAVRAFALYTAGEVAVRADREQGVRVLYEAVAEADRAAATHVSQVARLARLAALVRLGRHDEALELVTPLLHDERRAGAWPQLWTTMRIVAEMLASRGHHRDAALVLAAASTADSAPPVTGDDVSRYEQLTRQLRESLGGELIDRIGALASSIPRTQVLDRAMTLVGDLANSLGPGAPGEPSDDVGLQPCP